MSIIQCLVFSFYFLHVLLYITNISRTPPHPKNPYTGLPRPPPPQVPSRPAPLPLHPDRPNTIARARELASRQQQRRRQREGEGAAGPCVGPGADHDDGARDLHGIPRFGLSACFLWVWGLVCCCVCTCVYVYVYVYIVYS